MVMHSIALKLLFKNSNRLYMSQLFLLMHTTTFGQLVCSCFQRINLLLLLVYTSLKQELYLLL